MFFYLPKPFNTRWRFKLKPSINFFKFFYHVLSDNIYFLPQRVHFISSNCIFLRGDLIGISGLKSDFTNFLHFSKDFWFKTSSNILICSSLVYNFIARRLNNGVVHWGNDPLKDQKEAFIYLSNAKGFLLNLIVLVLIAVV